MQLAWKTFWQKSKTWLKAGWLITAGLGALYIGTMQSDGNRGIAQERGTGIAATEREPVSLGPPSLYDRVSAPEPAKARLQPAAMMSSVRSVQPQAAADDRKMVRTSSMDLVAKSPADAAEKIRQLSQRLGGSLINSTINGAEDSRFATLTIRVPASRFEEARSEICKMGLRVESERVEAQDVTKQYVDLDASLRNLKAEEAQYLSIMKRANTVKDTLAVSEKLSEVRGQIEELQAEFDALSKLVETVAITVSLHAEADAQVFGLHWRPFYQLKLAARDGLDGLGSYVATMVSFAFLLPTILLWLLTILLGAALGWRILRWAGRTVFGVRQAATVTAPGPC